MVGSPIVAVRRGGRRRRLVVVIRFVVVRCYRRPLLSSSVAVRRGLLFIVRCCPSFVRVRRALLRGFASLALRLAMGEVDGAGRAWFSWALVVVCGVLHPLRVLVAVVRRSWCCVGRLLSFLDGWDRLRGWGLSDVAWERRGGEADAGCPYAVGRGCGQCRWRGGGSLKSQRHKDVTLAACSTCT